MGMGDFRLDWSSGSADLAILDDDLRSDEGLRTAVILSLFTDRRANAGDIIANPGDRRGWWGDQFLVNPGDRFGSRLWQLDRAKNTPGLSRDVEIFCRESLQWMIDDGVARSIDVVVEPGFERQYFSVTIHRQNGVATGFRFSHVWEGEFASTEAGVVISAPTSLLDVMVSPDPMQSLILGMGHNEKPDFMYIGDGNSGGTAIEVGGSGANLIEPGTSALLYDVADGVLGCNTTHHNTVADTMERIGQELNPGAGSISMLLVYRNDSVAGTRYIASRYESSLGWRNFQLGSNSRRFTVRSTAGDVSCAVAATIQTTDIQVDLSRRITSTNTVDLNTRYGSDSQTEASVLDIDTASEIFAIGARTADGGNDSALMKWGLGAFWLGAKSENVTPAHRLAFQNAIGA